MEIGGKSQHGYLWCVSHQISLFFFAKYDLFRLRNMPANFCDDAPSYCKVMSCIVIGGIGQYAIYVTFYIRFCYFFLLNII